ncbi:MAG: NAD(P)/FAD-dependent oxidoreductase, partial [Lachnospiraceae bacterium]
MSNVIVIGGGAAGMMAALAAAYHGHTVTIMEKNEKLGKKIFITGKGRCNVTNAADMDTIMSQVVSNRKFLYSAFYGFSNQDVMDLLERLGCPLKIERGNRVFPVSDHAYDVIDAFHRELKKLGVKILLHTTVKHLWVEDGMCKGVILEDKKVNADAVIVATGGRSYPSTGSTGDGYRFAREVGHQVTPLYPALVPFTVAEPWCTELMGLSLKNVQVRILDGKKELYQEFGEMLFTHFGVSGPAILSGSSIVAKKVRKKTLNLLIDLKPALSLEQLDARILRDFTENRTRQFKNSLSALLPSK